MARRIAAILSLDVAGYSERMAADAEGTLQELRRVLRDVVWPAVRERSGRIVKLMGDGALAEFTSAGDALLAAQSILQALRDDPVQLRAGVHVGDVSVEGTDIFGDAVNIAARLQEAAPAGGGFISQAAADMAGGGLKLGLKPQGALRLKGLPRPLETLALDIDGSNRTAAFSRHAASQEIRFATSTDGVHLAWTVIGAGPVLVKAPNWIQHLELDWQTINAGWLADLAAHHRLVRFDQRGNGLSDRDLPEISMDRFVDDLAAVFDAAGVDRAPLIAYSQGAAIGAAFAARQPERVSKLIVVGGFAQGDLVRSEPRHVELAAAVNAMGRVGWDDDYPSIRDHFARILVPDSSADDQRIYAEAMRASITAEAFGRFREAVGHIDVTGILPAVRCPALILHATGDRMQPIEQGRRLAAGIPDARFVALPTRNHIMPHYDPAWAIASREIEGFLSRPI